MELKQDKIYSKFSTRRPSSKAINQQGKLQERYTVLEDNSQKEDNLVEQKSEGLIEKVIAEKLVDAPYNINKKDQSPVRQKPPSTLNLQESNNKVDSLISTSSQNNSPMPKENRDSNPRSASPSKQMNSPRRRKKKRSSASWYNVLSPTYRQKNLDFHKFFKDIPENERLIIDASCALVHDILVQGRLYVSQNYVCFHSKILKWQKSVVIKLEECEKISKQKLAKVIPNAICFLTSSKGETLFTSFTSRDRTFAAINKVWQFSRENTPMTPQQLWDNVREQYGSDLGCSSESDYVKPDSAEEESKKHKKKKSTKKKSKSTPGDDFNSAVFTPQPSTINTTNLPTTTCDDAIRNEIESQNSVVSESSTKKQTDSSFVGCISTEFVDNDPGPAKHVTTNLKNVYINEKYKLSPAEVFNVIYGDNSSFYKQYLESQGTREIKYGKWQPICEDGTRIRVLDYVLPLTSSIGPDSSRIVEKQILHANSQLGRSYSVDNVAQNHGIPYADYFQTVVRYSIRKVDNETSEIRVSAGLKFLKEPWGMVRKFIEKNAYAGIQENFDKLSVILRKHVNKISEQKLNSFKSESSSVKQHGTLPLLKSTSNEVTANTITEDTQESTLVTRNSTDLSKKNSTLSSMLSTINQLIHFDSSTLVYALIFLLIAWLWVSNKNLQNRLEVLENNLQQSNKEETATQTILLKEIVKKLTEIQLEDSQYKTFNEVRWNQQTDKINKIFKQGTNN